MDPNSSAPVPSAGQSAESSIGELLRRRETDETSLMTADTARGRGIGQIPGSDYTQFIFASMGWSSSGPSIRDDDESTDAATTLSDDTAKRSRLWGVDPGWFRGPSFENPERLPSLHNDPYTQARPYLEEPRFTTRSSEDFLNGAASFASRFHNIQRVSATSPNEASPESEDFCIGVCGVNAAGRSTLINALRGLHSYSDSTSTDAEPADPSPVFISHSQLRYFDSRSNPRSTVQRRLVWHNIPDPREFRSSPPQSYERIQFGGFDSVLIVTDLTNSETERQIMLQCAKSQVPCLLVYPGHDASPDQLLAVQRSPRISEAPIAALLDGIYFTSAVRWLMEGCLVVDPAAIRNFMTISGDETASTRETSDTETFIHDLLMAATWRSARRKPAKRQETSPAGSDGEKIPQTEEDPSQDSQQDHHVQGSPQQPVARTAMSALVELPAEQLRNLRVRSETAIQWFFITRSLRGK